MTELTKLIEQYERETGNRSREQVNEFKFYTISFVEWLASRPTCGVEQRKFLDEIEKEEFNWHYGRIEFHNDTDFDFDKVVKGE